MRNWVLVGLLGLLLGGPSRCEPETPPDAAAIGHEQGPACGPQRCASGEVCCDASCGLCAASSSACSKQQCPPTTRGDSGSGSSTASQPQCGGFAGRPCPGLGRCEDDPRDSCDPKKGGADCGGVCTCDALAKCRAGQTWNASPSVCSCEGGDEPGKDAGGGEACGKVICARGEVCCNPSCGTCTAPGQGCTKQLCVDDDTPQDKVFCGGIAAFQCPGDGQCVDDPSDSCDPAQGGADCGGVCRCDKGAHTCPKTSTWNASPKVCGCEVTAPSQGPVCGSKACPTGQVCCNPSCGICTPPGGACTQQFCN